MGQRNFAKIAENRLHDIVDEVIRRSQQNPPAVE
jgi:hypothetical protein